MEGRVTIVGLGCTGSSIGLALRQRAPSLEIVGHDIDADRARQAKQMEAVSKTHWNLPAACEGASLVVLSLPLPTVRETLEVLGPHLEEGCVVTDTAALKTPVLEWAQYLPAHVSFITGVPIPGPAIPVEKPLTGPGAACVDLFENGLYCVMPTQDTDPAAVTMLLGLAQALGARPLFLEPLEYDGLWAGAVDLPALLAAVFLQATVDSPGWMDMRKVAGYDFATFTAPAVVDPSVWREIVWLNRENLLRRLDMFLEELRRTRQWLVESDEEAMEGIYTCAAEGRARWLQERAKGTWGEVSDVGEMPSAGSHLVQSLFGGLVRRRPRGGQSPPKED